MYISGAHVSLFCLVFIRSHTRTNAENIGGNAYSIFDSELKMTDFVVSKSWTDSACGDSVHHVSRCSAWIKRYNISDSVDNNCGGACGDYWTQNADSLVSFANLVNNKGGDAFIISMRGVFYSEKLNIANNTHIAYWYFYTEADYTEFRECCIFRATSHSDIGTYTMIDCFTNYAREGATITETTIKRFLFSLDCPIGKSFLFTQQDDSGATTVLRIVVLIFSHFGISNVK